jgi:penicillin-binding protein 1C
MTRKLKIRIWIAVGVVALIGYYFALPDTLFNDPYSTVLEDHNGELLSASIAADGQWRFPLTDSVSSRFRQALIAFEDRRFDEHFGVDIRAMARATQQNIAAREIVSGGSTLSMQVIRLSRKGKSRNVFEKVIEMIMATRLEWRYTKDEILSIYASHAPFGGNVVGIDAACWRYFGRDSKDLSWGEAALLAVLPNAPSLMHLNKNREKLKEKRDRLLDRLLALGKIDSEACALAKEESIPDAPVALPRHARHLLLRATKEGHYQKRIVSTIDLPLQTRAEEILQRHSESLRGNQVFNAAAIVIDVNSGKTLAYVGNAEPGDDGYHGNDVDIITARRSTGSILKPFLYAAMLDEGKILPHTILPDIPTLINGFAPKNFSREYDGAVHADQALIRSLNVPAVHMLRDYRYEKLHSLLKEVGMNTLNKPPSHYGLSLILGGAEGTLWDITSMYANMARSLNHFFDHAGADKYDKADYHSAFYSLSDTAKIKSNQEMSSNSPLSAASVYLTFEALKEVYRPGEETGWRHFNSARRIAWKTGTSFGLRDGWAVGVTPDYVVGIWVGNADGEGRPGLTGTETAAPIMFDIFGLLPETRWFHRPEFEMSKISVCSKSGRRNTNLCHETDTIWIPKPGLESIACQSHQNVHLSADRRFRLNTDCASLSTITTTTWFILPPVQEFYFRRKNSSYRLLPPFKSGCQDASRVLSMDLVYPKARAKIFIPRQLDGTLSTVVFVLADRKPAASVFWHVDGVFMGSTRKGHHLTFQPTKGTHKLTLVDEFGESLERDFEVISDM